MDSDTVEINDEVSIPLAELSFRYSRSSGPGGQHAQKSSTRVELLFDVGSSPSLTDKQRKRILKRLAGYIDTAGFLHLASQSERSQLRNKEEVVARFQELVREALKRRKRRKATKPTAESKERRLKEKQQRSQTKKLRRKVRDAE
ncbi:MAG: alternative ribosome rescue aminoacyl-tRNA hydrolase ArfB [Anaerolineae bacterium]|jgi:ribosome-associated protein